MRWASRAFGWLFRRLPHRVQRSVYAAAMHNRLTADWVLAHLLSADEEVKASAATLRARARDLVRSNAWAARYLDLVADNVIGHEGIQLQAHVTRPTAGGKELLTEVNEELERAWKDWGRPENASVDGTSSWVDIETLAMQGLAQDGESFIRMVPAFNNPYAFALQVIDPDQVDASHNVAPSTDSLGNRTPEIRMGVEIDRWGRRVAYHVWNEHPGAFGGIEKERIRIPASEMIHLYVRKRPSQTRGITWLAPAMLDLKMLGGYQEAELVAARVASAKMGFFKREAEYAGTSPDSEEDGNDFTVDGEPGSFGVLPDGLSFQGWDPTHPTTAFEQFVKSILRSVATALGVSYASLSNDLSDVNFSSIRTGMLAERDHWRKIQRWVAMHLHSRVYREWLRHAILAGAVNLPTRRTTDYHDVKWQPRGWPWVDPVKDAQAASLQIRLGTNSRTRIAAEQGRDFEDVLADLAMEKEAAERFGVALTTDTSTGGGENGQEEDRGATVIDIRQWVRQRRLGAVPRDEYPGRPGPPVQPSRNGDGRAHPDRPLVGAPR